MHGHTMFEAQRGSELRSAVLAILPELESSLGEKKAVDRTHTGQGSEFINRLVKEMLVGRGVYNTSVADTSLLVFGFLDRQHT